MSTFKEIEPAVGFQHMVLEYARDVLGFKDAQHAEYDPYASDLFVSQLECSLAGREMPLKFSPGSKVAAAYGSLLSTEEYYCNFGVNPAMVALLGSGQLQVTGSDPEGEIRVVGTAWTPFFPRHIIRAPGEVGARAPPSLVTHFLSVVAAQPNKALHPAAAAVIEGGSDGRSLSRTGSATAIPPPVRLETTISRDLVLPLPLGERKLLHVHLVALARVRDVGEQLDRPEKDRLTLVRWRSDHQRLGLTSVHGQREHIDVGLGMDPLVHEKLPVGRHHLESLERDPRESELRWTRAAV